MNLLQIDKNMFTEHHTGCSVFEDCQVSEMLRLDMMLIKIKDHFYDKNSVIFSIFRSSYRLKTDPPAFPIIQ